MSKPKNITEIIERVLFHLNKNSLLESHCESRPLSVRVRSFSAINGYESSRFILLTFESIVYYPDFSDPVFFTEEGNFRLWKFELSIIANNQSTGAPNVTHLGHRDNFGLHIMQRENVSAYSQFAKNASVNLDRAIDEMVEEFNKAS